MFVKTEALSAASHNLMEKHAKSISLTPHVKDENPPSAVALHLQYGPPALPGVEVCPLQRGHVGDADLLPLLDVLHGPDDEGALAVAPVVVAVGQAGVVHPGHEERNIR